MVCVYKEHGGGYVYRDVRPHERRTACSEMTSRSAGVGKDFVTVIVPFSEPL